MTLAPSSPCPAARRPLPHVWRLGVPFFPIVDSAPTDPSLLPRRRRPLLFFLGAGGPFSSSLVPARPSSSSAPAAPRPAATPPRPFGSAGYRAAPPAAGLLPRVLHSPRPTAAPAAALLPRASTPHGPPAAPTAVPLRCPTPILLRRPLRRSPEPTVVVPLPQALCPTLLQPPVPQCRFSPPTPPAPPRPSPAAPLPPPPLCSSARSATAPLHCSSAPLNHRAAPLLHPRRCRSTAPPLLRSLGGLE